MGPAVALTFEQVFSPTSIIASESQAHENSDGFVDPSRRFPHGVRDP